MDLKFISVLAELCFLHRKKLLLYCVLKILLRASFLAEDFGSLMAKAMFLVRKCLDLFTIIIKPVLVITRSEPKGFRGSGTYQVSEGSSATS